MHLLLTGASGYIGSELLAKAAAQGAEITILGSAPQYLPAMARVRVLAWRLGESIPGPAFSPPPGWAGVSAVVHLAHDWSTREGPGELNRGGTALLLEAARSNAVKRFVFVSSLSARPDALNRYGRIKASVESLLQTPGELAARVGLVYGGLPRGLYGTMLSLTRLSPVLPMVDAGQSVQPIHTDEVCSGLLTLASRPELGKPVYGLASERPLAFGAFLKLLARHCHRRSLTIVPVPRGFALFLADLSGKLPGVPAIDRERILGLAGIRFRSTAADLRELQLEIRPVAEGLARPFRRRRLLEEGSALLAYCAGGRASGSSLRFYVQALQQLSDADPLGLPGWARRWPALLRLLDAAALPGSPLRRRLGIAARIAESGPEAPERFQMMHPASRIALFTRLSALAAIECGLMGLRAVRLVLRRRA